jgi:branched-chain amino acid transport system permease protein
MSLLWQVVVNGILLGGLYALMALGLALVWGVLNIVNLAHGAFIMLGAYACYYLFAGLSVDPFAALPVAMLALFAFGYVLQRYVLNLVVRAPMFNTLLITFGIDVVLTYLAQIAFSADFRTINPGYAGDSFEVLLWALLFHTRTGRAIRATAQNLTAARLYGIAPRMIYPFTFALGAALAGAAGGLYGLVSQVNPYIGAPLTAKSFAIAIIGGLDNPLGVIVGGLFLGVVESLTSLYIGPTYADVASFGILVLVLIVRPTGILGRTA